MEETKQGNDGCWISVSYNYRGTDMFCSTVNLCSGPQKTHTSNTGVERETPVSMLKKCM